MTSMDAGATAESLHALVDRTMHSASATSDDYLEFLDLFEATPFYMMVQPVEGGKVGVARLEVDGIITLQVAENRETALHCLGRDGMELREVNGAILLDLARSLEFALAIKLSPDTEEWVTISYAQLILLGRIASMRASIGNEVKIDERAVQKLYPKAFSRWLYQYCRDNRDIERCWLGFLVVGSQDNTDLLIMLDSRSEAYHFERIDQRMSHHVSTGNCLLRGVEALPEESRARVQQDIRTQPPLYSRGHRQHIFARLWRSLHPAPVFVQSVCLREEDDVNG